MQPMRKTQQGLSAVALIVLLLPLLTIAVVQSARLRTHE